MVKTVPQFYWTHSFGAFLVDTVDLTDLADGPHEARVWFVPPPTPSVEGPAPLPPEPPDLPPAAAKFCPPRGSPAGTPQCKADRMGAGPAGPAVRVDRYDERSRLWCQCLFGTDSVGARRRARASESTGRVTFLPLRARTSAYACEHHGALFPES
jgi:hypothetical protein